MIDRLTALALVIADQAIALEELRRKVAEYEAQMIRSDGQRMEPDDAPVR